MKGYRTIAVNAGIAALTAGVGYLANIDWNSVDPRAAIVAPGIVALLNIGLRFVTSTPVGRR
ncbi:hypothetical protein [Microvirga roseola]|uniref:hypothetical protein n=1 Tax=Microvirga roseola TaxID=2883126 RepID=UPI001E4B1B62|nr:hypothetical protein [Microvirga roseola]